MINLGSVKFELALNMEYPYLLQQSSLLDNVGDGLLLYATCLVNVLEGIHFLGSLMFNDPHLTACQRRKKTRGK